MMADALDGVRILDMSAVGMGPMSAPLLGDFGADVIKVESADGDVFRDPMPQRHHGMSHAFLNFNRNKRSVVIDLKAEEGRQNFFSLLETRDVFVSNMRAPALRRLGCDAPSLTQRFPRLIHCSCYGYAENPYAGRAAVDDTIQAACGLAWLQGDAGARAPFNSLCQILRRLAREATGPAYTVNFQSNPFYRTICHFLNTLNTPGTLGCGLTGIDFLPSACCPSYY